MIMYLQCHKPSMPVTCLKTYLKRFLETYVVANLLSEIHTSYI